MTRIKGSIPERGRHFSLITIAAVAGVFLTLSLQRDSFPLVSAFVNNKRSCRTFDPGFLLCRYKGESYNTGSGVTTSLKSGENSDISDETEADPKSLIELLSPISSCRPNEMSGTNLAYIGDVVFELFVRSRHVWPPKRTSDLQNTVVSLVRAEHQSHLLRQLKEHFPLSDKENQVLMRGRNSVTRSKNRRNPAAYQDSTALEALVGYIYITNPSRCQEFLVWLESVVDNLEGDS